METKSHILEHISLKVLAKCKKKEYKKHTWLDTKRYILLVNLILHGHPFRQYFEVESVSKLSQEESFPKNGKNMVKFCEANKKSVKYFMLIHDCYSQIIKITSFF